jgi:serine/threonine protein kinase/tetratricopeptide (TPR) repeat protein
MNLEHWQCIEVLFQAALEHQPEERITYLKTACLADDKLRLEVEALVLAHEKASNFIEKPAFKARAFELSAENPADADEQADDSTGRRIGSYRIIREIGRGGMGAVFLATRDDDEYQKQVAIKIIKRGMDTDLILRRFKNERQILASLEHPNIARLFDGGSTTEGLPYLVMEYIEGRPIDRYCDQEKLSTNERLKLFQQVCSAVHYAHQNLVIHRDLKPSNILVAQDGTPKLLDFGIAKLLNPGVDFRTMDATETAMRMMTPNYASPEQVRGEPITTASDVYSLGVLSYELLTGHRPYRLKNYSAKEILRAVLDEHPEKPSTAVSRVETTDDAPTTGSLTPESVSATREGEPGKLRRKLSGDIDNIVLMTLRKEPLRRYTSVDQLSEDISRHLAGLPILAHKDIFSYRVSKFIKRNKIAFASSISVAVVALLIAASVYLLASRPKVIDAVAIGSVAVLPFINAGDDANADYISEGLTDNLIESLSHLPDLAVKSRSAVLRYKMPAANANLRDAQTIGRELNVEAVLIGSIAQRGDLLFINIELIDARDNRHIWSKQYNRKATEILITEQEMAREVSEKLRLKPTGQEGHLLVTNHTENSEAYYLYLKGRHLWNKRTGESLRKSIDYYQQAIVKDENYAIAYAGIADSYVILGYILQPKECFEIAEVNAARALDQNNKLAEAHTSLARVNAAYRWDWITAEAGYTRAIELKPDYAVAHIWYAEHLAVLGRVEEALEEARLAQRLEPLSALVNSQLAWYLYLNHRYDEAIEQGQKTLEIDANLPAPYYFMGLAYVEKRMYNEAIKILKERLSVGETPAALQLLGYVYALSGQRDEAQKILDQMIRQSKNRYISPYFIGMIYVGLGNKDKAFEWFEKGWEDRSPWMLTLKLLPLNDSLHSDARYKALLRRMNLKP